MAAIKIDKSLFSPEELAMYQALLAKAAVNPEENQEEMEEELPPAPPARTRTPEPEPEDPEEENEVETEKCDTRTRKSAADPRLTAALARLDTLEKSAEMEKLTSVAKKYAALGEDEAELAQTLYDLKKSNAANYDAYIKILDKSLDLVTKSGIFAEIGKSGRGTRGSAEDRIEAAATEIQKSDPSLSREQARVKAWDANPDLLAEYEQEYRQ